MTIILPLLVFTDFSTPSGLVSNHFGGEFYSKIGAAICLAVLATGLLIPLGPLFSCRRIRLSSARCKDRGCSNNRDRTKMVNYQEYVHLHGKGKVFDTEAKYSKIVSLVLITMTFSASMPLLYLAGFMMFLGLYVVDKIMFLRGYQHPRTQDTAFLTTAINTMEFAIVPHLVASFLMFHNTGIFNSDPSIQNQE